MRKPSISIRCVTGSFALQGAVIDVSAHGVDRRERAEPRKYVRAANIPGIRQAPRAPAAAAGHGYRKSRQWFASCPTRLQEEPRREQRDELAPSNVRHGHSALSACHSEAGK